MSLAGGAPDHQGSHHQAARPRASDGFDQPRYLRAYADREILIENEKRLNRTNLTVRVPNREIPIVEALPERILDELVISMILTLTDKSAFPMVASPQFGARNNPHAAKLPGGGALACRSNEAAH